MYNHKQKYGFHNRNSNNNSAKKSHFQRGFGRKIKKLDPNLFIRKANGATIKEEISINANFSQYNISDKIKRNIADHGYVIPTEIQRQAIPQILEGKDLIGMANTGTGKTAAFLITLINKAEIDRNERVLIVVPTRELAIQIEDEFKIFAKGTGLESACLIGGENIKRQMYSLRHNPHFVIATPGRIKDLIERRQLNLMQFKNVVLDEVDRMVDVGFIKDIKYLISLLPKIRQSLFFSATVDSKTQEILRSFVTNPVTVSVKSQDTAENIDQNVIRVSDKNQKLDTLHNLLVKDGFNKVLIFGRTKWGMEKLSRALIDRGFRVSAIHGNKSQNQRQKALEEFKNDKIQILVATDVASRGLDIPDVSHVINYDEPATYDDYIHRIGRTGRANKKGIALTFIE